MSENCRRQEYNRYLLNGKEKVRYIAEGFFLVVVISYFFYRSVRAGCLLSPLVIWYLKQKKEELCKKRKQELRIQFKDAVRSVNGSLQAGYSMENAFAEAYRDMVEYHGADSMIAKELLVIKAGILHNQQVEDLIEDLGNRSSLEEIRDFAKILRVGKQTGGNLLTLFENTVFIIEEKTEIKQEIQIMVSARRLELRILSTIPFVIIFYVDMTSNGYFDVLYQEVAGKILMTVCLFVYAAALHVSRKIIEIEV